MPIKGGDPLCPLGFHPQVRWPTRCKRCFRDYKEHIAKKEADNSSNYRRNDDDSLSPRSSFSGSSDTNHKNDLPGINESSSTQNEAKKDFSSPYSSISSEALASLERFRRSVSPLETERDDEDNDEEESDEDDDDAATVVNNDEDVSVTVGLRRRPPRSPTPEAPSASSSNGDGEKEKKRRRRPRRLLIQSCQEVPPPIEECDPSAPDNPDVAFIIQVKSTPKHRDDDDTSSCAMTETTETTLVDQNDALQEQLTSLQSDVERLRERCDKLDKEKGELLNQRRFGSSAEGPGGSLRSELLRLQRQVHELKSTNEDLCDEQRSLRFRVQELEEDLESRPDAVTSNRTIEDMHAKFQASEAMVEELMEENSSLKRDIRDLADEMDELKDSFREDQADEYSGMKKELEQTAKNCRVLQFKLRKAEKRVDQVEAEKGELELRMQDSAPSGDRIRQLEMELAATVENSQKLQKQVEELQKGGTPAASNKLSVSPRVSPVLSKAHSPEGERKSLKRGSSQEDPAVLLRDLQASLEREADLREQMKFAEEESQTLRKNLSRVEDENETLLMQLKKMANKAKAGRRSSPSPARGTTPESDRDKERDKDKPEEEELCPTELKIQCELNEQEATVLRRRVEDLESENNRLQKEVQEKEEKLSQVQKTKSPTSAGSVSSTSSADAECAELRRKLIEKERETERLQAELSVSQRRGGGRGMVRSRSLDTDQQSVDLKRQLSVIEQEVSILRSKTQQLEGENEKLAAENRKLSLKAGRKNSTTGKEAVSEAADSEAVKEKTEKLEKQLKEANAKLKDLEKQLEAKSSTSAVPKKFGTKNVETEQLKKEKETLQKEVKNKEDEMKKIKTSLENLEKEKAKMSEQLKKLKDITPFKQRTPKKPSDTTSRLQLKKMVEELEDEIGDICVIMKGLEAEKKKLSEECKKGNGSNVTQLQDIKKELEEEKSAAEKARAELQSLAEKFEAAETQKKALEEEKSKIETERSKLEKEKKRAEEELVKSASGKATALEEIRGFRTKFETLQKNAAEEERKTAELKRQLEDLQNVKTVEMKKGQLEKDKMLKELKEKETKITEGETKLKEAEDKMKRTEKLLKDKREKLAAMEKELQEEREHLRQTEGTQKEVAVGWLKERDDMKKNLADLKAKTEELEQSVAAKEKQLKEMEAKIKEESKKATETIQKKTEREVRVIMDDNVKMKKKVEELEQKLEKTEKEKKVALDKQQKGDLTTKKEKEELLSKLTEAENKLKAEQKKLKDQEKEWKSKVDKAQEQIKKLEDDKKLGKDKKTTVKEAKLQELEEKLAKENREYEELTTKYDMLEEDYVVTKAQLVLEKEQAQGEYKSLKSEHETLGSELKKLRETFNVRQDTWIKEKLDMQEKLKELGERASRSTTETWTAEKMRLKDCLEEKNAELDMMRKEAEVLKNQIFNMKKDNDDLRHNLEDFEKVNKVQRNISVDTFAQDKELRELRNKLLQEERSHKTEIAQQKMRFESKLAATTEELQTTQSQYSKSKRERDTYREMLEGAQKALAEVKSGKAKRDSYLASDEAESARVQVTEFQQQVASLEDELSEAKVEQAKLRTELVNEKAAAGIKTSELQTRINELEEDRLLSSGRTRTAGMKTRMELAWQKEREDQQRLVQETSTLARDLRQTLFEVERERDRERLESKRRVEQLKRTMDEEQDETRRKISEMQFDLLELRDAHAKLRTTNEKMRRDKDRAEREREDVRHQMSDHKRSATEEQRAVALLLQQVEEMVKLMPAEEKKQPSLPPRKPLRPLRPGEAPPEPPRKDTRVPDELLKYLGSLSQIASEVKRLHQTAEEETDKERQRRAATLRRTASADQDEPQQPSAGGWRSTQTLQRTPGSSSATSGAVSLRNSLYRKSLSLEQTNAGPDQNLWKPEDDGGSNSSLQSLQSVDERILGLRSRSTGRDTSVDRISTGSTQSEVIPSMQEKKKKKGLLGKLKMLTKSSSTDESSSKHVEPSSHSNAGSDLSLDMEKEEERGSKKDLKEKLGGIFSKKTPTSSAPIRSSSSDVGAPSSRSSTLQRSGQGGSGTLSYSSMDERPGSSSSMQRPLSSSSMQRPLVPLSSTARRVSPGPTMNILSPAAYSALLSTSSAGSRRSVLPLSRSLSSDLNRR